LLRLAVVGAGLSAMIACDYGFTLPSDDPGPSGPVSPGQKLGIRYRVPILPGGVTGPPPPDAGLTASQCDDMQDGGPLMGDSECLSGTITCGDVIIGNTRGGVKRYDTKFYEHSFCTPGTTQHDGGDERVYLLELTEPQVRAIVYLDTPCANLDLAAVKYNSDYCPSDSSNIPQCEMYPKSGTTREKVDLYNNNPTKWYIIVEGQGNEEGSFALTVQCEKW
jgi:hypothetical protein